MALRKDTLVQLFLTDRQALLRYVRRLLGSREGSEDIVQETLLRAHQHSQTLTAPRAFAFTTARNLVADFRRHRRVEEAHALGDSDDSTVVPWSESPERLTMLEEGHRLLREAVQQLPPQCRAAFSLRVFEDCSYKDIALRLGISPKTVENHVGRGLREMYILLRERYQLTPTDHE